MLGHYGSLSAALARGDAASKAQGRSAPLQSAESQARLQQLWQAILGTSDAALTGSYDQRRNGFWISPPGPMLDAGMLIGAQQSLASLYAAAPPTAPARPTPRPVADGPLSLGANMAHAPAITAAAQRSGLSPAGLAAIIDAEAARLPDGRWNAESRNPRSSATGLAQFIDSTWISEAQRPGTLLNDMAQARGWLTQDGTVRPESRRALLAMRTDPATAIFAAADYASANLAALRERGLVSPQAGPDTLARSAYLAHHLGLDDASRFLSGGLPPARARSLLTAQVGADRAAAMIRAEGGAREAHRAWLNDYIDRRIAPARFAALTTQQTT